MSNITGYDCQKFLREHDNINLVTCGCCGKAICSELEVEEITCPYCGFTEDRGDFPDLYWE